MILLMKTTGTGQRHELSWNPFFGWEVLRRSKLYQRAVLQFQQEAHAHEMERVLRLFEQISIEEDSVEVTGPDVLGYQRKLQSVAKEIYDVPANEFPMGNFLLNYGDVLRFPIHFKVVRPWSFYLNALWQLRPAILADEDHLSAIEQERRTQLSKSTAFQRTAHIHLEINSHFSDAMILSEAKRCLLKALNEIRSRTNLSPSQLGAKRPDWEEVYSYFPVWDVYQDYQSEDGYKKLAKQFFPDRPTNEGQDLVRHRIEAVNEYIDLMDRRNSK